MKSAIGPWAVWLMLLVTAAACGSDASASEVSTVTAATGVVVAVDGDLSEINSFSIVMSGGETLALAPESGLLFDGNEPLSHVRDHMVSGGPVAVEFYQDGNNLVCVAVGDAE